MIYAQPGVSFEATSSNAPTGLVGTIGVSIVDGQGATITARSTAGIVESPAGSGIYIATLTAPTTAGQYVVAWDTGGATPTWASEDLAVTYSAVTATPSGRDLCTVPDVRTLMQKKAGDTAQDALIQALITRASVKIMRDYGREFVPGGANGEPAVNATRTFEYAWGDQYPGEAFVSLAPYDLQPTPAATVSVDTDQAAPIALSTDEWRPWPRPAPHGVYLAVKVFPLNVPVGVVGWRKRQLQVTGNWGFPSIPLEVTQAAAETVVHWITASPATHRFSPEGGMPNPVQPRALPMTAIDLLSAFKRMTV